MFVIGRDGTIRFASISGDYRWRVGPDEVLAALRGCAMAITDATGTPCGGRRAARRRARRAWRLCGAGQR
jgi:hypothetical protein